MPTHIHFVATWSQKATSSDIMFAFHSKNG
jgi:hypothetical protein